MSYITQELPRLTPVYHISEFRYIEVSVYRISPTPPYTPYSSAKTFFGQNNGQVRMVEVCRQGLKFVFVVRRLSHHRDMKRKI